MLVAVSMGMIMRVIVATAAVVVMGVSMLVMMMRTGLAVVVMMALRSMLVGVFMRPMVVMIVPVNVAMAVGAAFGIERRQHGFHGGAQPLQHVLDDMIVADPQPITEKLGRQVPVAEMPGDTDQFGRTGSPDLQKALGNGLHQDQTTIFKLKGIAILHYGGLLEIEEKHRLADAAHDEAAAMTIVAFESERVGRRAGPGSGGKDSCCGDHDDRSLRTEEEMLRRA